MQDPKSTQANLVKCAKWAKYLGYITIAGLILSFLQIIFGAINNKGNLISSIFGFIISAVISLIMAINLLNFSKFTGLFLNNNESTYLTQGFTHLKNYFLVIGVIFIIMLSLLILFILFAIIVVIAKT